MFIQGNQSFYVLKIWPFFFLLTRHKDLNFKTNKNKETKFQEESLDRTGIMDWSPLSSTSLSLSLTLSFKVVLFLFIFWVGNKAMRTQIFLGACLLGMDKITPIFRLFFFIHTYFKKIQIMSLKYLLSNRLLILHKGIKIIKIIIKVL